MVEPKVAYLTRDGYTWDTIASRLESCARGNGVKIVAISVVVYEGKPVYWTKPLVTTVEPANRMDKFVALLTGESKSF